VVDGIAEKLERRHPHIFGAVEVDSAEQVSINWDRIKREEEGEQEGRELKVPTGLPAMIAALKIQGQAARAGFDWAAGEDVFEKLEEESRELWEARDGVREEREKELGDLLFTVVNIARHIGVDPERSLRMTCDRFARRYSLMEDEARRRGVDFPSLSLEEKDGLWEGVKLAEGGATGVEGE